MRSLGLLWLDEKESFSLIGLFQLENVPFGIIVESRSSDF